ncbi:MAG TPA: histone deacetylase family protein [Candidatus Limnocylindrales bacterium]|nr:histone deacetylase family protein [Candidatus Limnocylindrales bacterium]
MKAVYTPRHRAHDVTRETWLGQPVPAHEVAERAELIRAALIADGGFEIVSPTEHGEAPIAAVHDPGLVRFLETAWPEFEARSLGPNYLVADTYPSRALYEGMSAEAIALIPEPTAVEGRAGWWGLDTANPIVAGTYEAARWAVDVALSAADLSLAGEPAVYGLCRPPGHHAARSMAAGFCFFNNAAIATQELVRQTGEPVAILDLDFHHGNGTQQIFWRRGDVLYVSLHGDPMRIYPFFIGHANERGEAEGAGANLNIPLPAGTDDEAYLAALDRALEAIEATAGRFVVVSLGFDTYVDDPICDLALTTPVYHEIGRRVAALGRQLVILQEGGYHLPSLGPNAVGWLRGAAGRPGVPSRRDAPIA